MNLEKIRNALQEFSDEQHLKLYEVAYHKNDQTLAVLFDEKFTMDRLEEVSNKVSELLDKFEDEFADNYFLDVSTIGVERPIRNEDELAEAVGSYIFIQTKNKEEYYGDLKSYTNGVLSLDVSEKNKIRNYSVEYKNIRKVRYAVKF